MKYSDITELSSVVKLTLSVDGLCSQCVRGQTVYAKQNDRESRYLEVTVKKDKQVMLIPANADVRIRCIKPDKTSIFNEGCVHSGKVYVELTKQMLSCAGQATADIVISVGDSILSTASFVIDIKRAEYDEDSVVSSGEFSALTNALDEINEALGTLDDLHASDVDYTPETGLSALNVQDAVSELDLHTQLITSASGESVVVTDSAARALKGMTLYGKSVQNGTPTPNTPVEVENAGKDGSIEVSLCGKNLVESAGYATESTKVYAGLVSAEVKIQKGKQYAASVLLTASAETSAYWNSNSGIFARQSVVISPGTNRYVYVFTALADSDGENIVFLSKEKDDNIAITASDFQIEFGEIATDYHQPEVNQTLSVSTPNGLPGIAVAQGGNYTDEDGQQWICDEIDFDRGVYIKRIREIVLSSEAFILHQSGMLYSNCLNSGSIKPQTGKEALCNRLKWVSNNNATGEVFGMGSNGIYIGRCNSWSTPEELSSFLQSNETYIVYPLAVPVETALSADEIAACKALKTYKPISTVINDDGAYMKVSYAADIKNYIDNKIEKLAASLA